VSSLRMSPRHRTSGGNRPDTRDPGLVQFLALRIYYGPQIRPDDDIVRSIDMDPMAARHSHLLAVTEEKPWYRSSGTWHAPSPGAEQPGRLLCPDSSCGATGLSMVCELRLRVAGVALRLADRRRYAGKRPRSPGFGVHSIPVMAQRTL
jgi:hypothetical protein